MADLNKNIIKHLEIIQEIINRLSSHKPQFQRWFISLITAINIFNINKDINNKFLVLLLISLSFLLISNYYLYLERIYINLYNDVRKKDDTDFSLDIKKYKNIKKYLFTFCSKSNLIYYIVIGISISFINFSKIPDFSLCQIIRAIIYFLVIIILFCIDTICRKS